MGLIDEIGDQLYGFAAWLWGKLDPPERKPWCAAFYFVAQEDASLTYPEDTLGQKMADAVAAVTAAAAAVESSIHVVYRTVPADPVTTDPVAKVVRFLGPETGTAFFPDCYDPGTFALLDTGRDLTCFLDWVYTWCPADHYAIFIWGHSFGPAGLFEPGSGLNIPKPGITALTEAFEHFQATRIAKDPVDARQPEATPVVGKSQTGPSAVPPGPAPGSGSAAAGGAIQQWALSGDKKVEIVLFQDCWMSTLETAFEIAGSANRMIASQSLLPIGTNYANFVWPYSDLLNALASVTGDVDMAGIIAKFYVDHFAQVQYLTTIPVSLFDLSVVPTVSAALSALVPMLTALPPVERQTLIEPARLFELDSTDPFDPVLLAGDGALLDMLKLSTGLQAVPWPAPGSSQAQSDARQAAMSFETALRNLVKFNKEAHPPADPDLGFQGVSTFHWPPVVVTSDDFITEAIRRSVGAYRGLKFVQQTAWDQLGLEHKP